MVCPVYEDLRQDMNLDEDRDSNFQWSLKEGWIQMIVKRILDIPTTRVQRAVSG
jgi:hypothetical protein